MSRNSKHRHKRRKIDHNKSKRSLGLRQFSTEPAPIKPLELVVKGDTDGCEDAVCNILLQNNHMGVPISIIHRGVGDICKNDILQAATASQLIIGFNVDVLPKITGLCKEHNVEIRLYSVIYKIHEDIKQIAASLQPPKESTEERTGLSQVIALFKSSRRSIILGCEVTQGKIQVGDRFRILKAMNPVHFGIVESLHIEKNVVTKATVGQQVGLKISNFKNARIGDLVECYHTIHQKKTPCWLPTAKVLYL